jgi:hypothetical protein
MLSFPEVANLLPSFQIIFRIIIKIIYNTIIIRKNLLEQTFHLCMQCCDTFVRNIYK